MPETDFISARIKKIQGSPIRALQARVEEMKAKGIGVISLGIGEPRWKTPAAALKALGDYERKPERILAYPPNQGLPMLLEAVAAELSEQGLKYAKDEIIVGNGGREILDLAMACLVNPGDAVICVAPYWVTYPELAKKFDGVPYVFPTLFADGFVPDAEKLEELILKCRGEDEARRIILVMCDPSNPLGRRYEWKTLEAVAELVKRHDAFLISDEIYSGLVDGYKSIASIDGMKERTLIATGMAKAYSMTAFAIGFGAGPLELIRQMNKLKGHNSVTPLITQEAALAVLGAPKEEKEAYRREMREEFVARKKIVDEWLGKRGIGYAESAEGLFYIYPDFSKYFGTYYENADGSKSFVKSAGDFALFMLEQGRVNLIPGPSFSDRQFDPESENHLRISLSMPQETLRKALGMMDDALAKLKR